MGAIYRFHNYHWNFVQVYAEMLGFDFYLLGAWRSEEVCGELRATHVADQQRSGCCKCYQAVTPRILESDLSGLRSARAALKAAAFDFGSKYWPSDSRKPIT
jgi:hypothetical protein